MIQFLYTKLAQVEKSTVWPANQTEVFDNIMKQILTAMAGVEGSADVIALKEM